MSWYHDLPKLELHLHLEGAIPLPAFWSLLQKYGGDPAVPDVDSLQRRFRFRDFAHFIETWEWHCRFLREYDDFTLIAEAVARDLAAQRVLYAEVFYSPSDFSESGLSIGGITEAIRRGLDRVPTTRVALVADLVRDVGPARAARTLAEVNEVRGYGVVGIGIGGSEQRFPPEPFAPVYAEARRLGLHTSAHAGEAAGAASIRGALNVLQVERIGHGTRAYEDESLLDDLAARQVPLEMCPLSNVRTGVVAAIEQHPIRRYYEHGLKVTVSTDDPEMFGNSLAEEYRVLVERLGMTASDIRTLILNSVDAAWLPEADKRTLRQTLLADPTFAASAIDLHGKEN